MSDNKEKKTSEVCWKKAKNDFYMAAFGFAIAGVLLNYPMHSNFVTDVVQTAGIACGLGGQLYL